MSFGLQVMDATGALVWDSSTVLGGVAVDHREYAAGFAGETINYSLWASYTTFILTQAMGGDSAPGITLDTSSGTPIVTVAPTSFAESFTLFAY